MAKENAEIYYNPKTNEMVYAVLHPKFGWSFYDGEGFMASSFGSYHSEYNGRFRQDMRENYGFHMICKAYMGAIK